MQSTPQGRFPNLFDAWSFEPGTVTDLWGLALGLVVLLVTGYVAYRQFQIMNRQTEMMERQDKIIQQQLLRRGIMTMLLRPSRHVADGYARRYRVVIANIGTKSVADYYWEVLIEPALLNQSNLSLHNAIKESEPAIVDKRHYTVFQRHAGMPIYPSTNYDLGFIDIREPLPEGIEPKIFWKLSCEDGQFPADAAYGQIPLTL